MPEVFYTSFRCSETWAETTAGGFVTYAWKANSLYDPDAALGGLSANGWASLSNVYGRYCVLSASLAIEYVNNDTDDPVWIAVLPSRELAPLAGANKEYILSQPRCKYALVTNQAGAGNAVNFQITKDMFGFTTTDDVNLSAAYNADPASLWYFHTYIFNRSGNALAGVARVSIVQYARCFSLRTGNFIYSL